MADLSSKIPVILLAFANDDSRSLRELDEEQRELRQVLKSIKLQRVCDVLVLAAATAEDVIQAFQEHRARICMFHYGGHSNTDRIFFKDIDNKRGINAKNLAQFLAQQQGLELIFLNSCLSLPQAKQYHLAGAKAVLATNHKIGDAAARKFARLFYTSLAAGATIVEAYLEAGAAIHVKGDKVFRSLDIEDQEDGFPWQLFPQKPADWRLPLVAKYLTRIPTIDLKKEFIGRKTDIQRLKETLESSSKVVLMNGLGGIGKTILAIGYMQQFDHLYDHLVWINRGEDLITSVALNEDLADSLGLPFQKNEEMKDRFRNILRKLHNIPGRNLMVIDNAQEQITQKDIYDHLPGLPHWQVLLTSRLKFSGFESLSLDTLSPEASGQLFRTYYSGPCTEEELEALLQEIGYHTLTVELLAKLLDKLNELISVSELTQMLQQKQLADSDLQEKIWARHSGEERGIYMHLMKAFELTQSRLADRELWLLKQLVVLPVEPYTVTTLADFLQEEPLKLNKTLNSLSVRGWLSQHENNTFSIHRLIRQVVEYQLQPSFEDAKILVKSMIDKMSVDAYASRITATVPWINHAITLENYFHRENQKEIANLQHEIAANYRSLGQNDEALRYIQKSFSILKPEFDINLPKLAGYYNNIAAIYHDLGKHSEALRYQEKSLIVLDSVPSPNKFELAHCYCNMAKYYRSLGLYEKALYNNQRSLTLCEALYEANHPNLANSYNDIAITYRYLGQYNKALSYQKRSLFINEEVLEPNHPSLATCYNNIAGTYTALGQYKKALSFHKKDLAILEMVLKPNHSSLASSYGNIARTFTALGMHEEALYYNQKSLAIYEATLEDNHPKLAHSYNSIADNYLDLKQYKMALFYNKKSLAIREIVLGDDHPDLASSYQSIAETYHELRQYNEAQFYNQKSLNIREVALGSTHPDLATSFSNIARNYYALRQYFQAIGCQKKALSIYEKALGPNHPYLATSYENIALIYLALGQVVKAEKYQAKASAIRKKRREFD